MKLASIEIAGFRGVKQALSIQCPSGFLVIVGRNGSGKSTVCDAVEFCLTGNIRPTSHKEKGETIADYLWWRGRGAVSNRFVRVGFVDDKGETWQITRTPEGLDDASKTALSRLYHNDGAPENPLVGLCRTSFIRDEEITSLSVDLPEGDRYRFVRDALGTVEMPDIEWKIKRVRELSEARLTKDTSLYQRLRDRVADVTARLSDAKAALALETTNTNAEQVVRELLHLQNADVNTLTAAARQSLSQERIQIDRLHRLFTDVQELAQQQLTLETEEFTKQQQDLERTIADAAEALANQSKEREQLEQVLATLKQDEPDRAARAELLQNGERLGLAAGERCPLCGSAVAAHAFSEHITNARHSIAQEAARLVGIVSRHAEVTRERDTLLQKHESLTSRYREHVARRKSLEDRVARVVQEATSVGVTITDDNRIVADKIRQQIEVIRGHIQQLEQALTLLESSRTAEKVQLLESELQQVKQQSDDAFSAAARTEKAIAKLKKAHNSTRSVLGEIIDEQLSELSPLIEELYKRLRPHVEWTNISYRLRGDVRRLLSFEVGDSLNPSFVFSSGQRRAAGLAFLLAVHLSRRWCNWNTLVLDDPVQHVDDFRALNLTEVLAAIRKLGRQVVCCVEDDALGQLLCRRLRSASDRDGGLIEMYYEGDNGVTVRRCEVVGPLRSEILIRA